MGSIYRLVAGLVLDEKLTVFIFDAIFKKNQNETSFIRDQ